MLDLDAATFAEERFAPFWRDSVTLRAEHAEEAGPRDGVLLEPNAALMQVLDDAGVAQIITARCNGRIFGYLATIISPSLESAALLVGTQCGFYVSRDFRGFGPRLQRASIEALRAKGVGEVLLRAGVRGCGPRMSSFYRRLGAQPYGELYSLMLGAH